MWHDSAQAKLDAQALTKFHQTLRLKVGENRKVVRDIPEQESTAALFLELYKQEVLTYDDIKKLAGANGDEPSESGLQAGNFSPEWNCVFSGPKDGVTLYRLLVEKEKTGIVLFCYNRNYYKEYPDDGMVVFLAGDTQARVMQPEEIAKQYNEITRESFEFATNNLAELDDSFYGKGPFKFVSPE